MPKKRVVTEEMALKAAAEVVREGGVEALNVRAVAQKLSSSTQPIYSLFKNMDALRRALFAEAKAEYRRQIDECLRDRSRNRYESFGLGFVRFARDEKGLFRYLFLSGKNTPDPFLEDIVDEMVTLYRMPEGIARVFHADMAVFSFGLAVLVNKQSEALSEEQISDAFKREFYALYGFYFPKRKRFWEE